MNNKFQSKPGGATKLPFGLRLLIGSMIIIAVIGSVGYLVGSGKTWRGLDFSKIGEASVLLILAGTLIGLIFYSYYTYRLALASWVPVGTFILRSNSKDPLEIETRLQNHTKVQNIEMKIKLNPTVNGKEFKMESKIYLGEDSWFLQPLLPGKGSFRIDTHILDKIEGESVARMRQAVNEHNYKEQLRFKVEITVKGSETGDERSYPERYYFYDFREGKNKLIFDPGKPRVSRNV